VSQHPSNNTQGCALQRIESAGLTSIPLFPVSPLIDQKGTSLSTTALVHIHKSDDIDEWPEWSAASPNADLSTALSNLASLHDGDDDHHGHSILNDSRTPFAVAIEEAALSLPHLDNASITMITATPTSARVTNGIISEKTHHNNDDSAPTLTRARTLTVRTSFPQSNDAMMNDDEDPLHHTIHRIVDAPTTLSIITTMPSTSTMVSSASSFSPLSPITSPLLWSPVATDHPSFIAAAGPVRRIPITRTFGLSFSSGSLVLSPPTPPSSHRLKRRHSHRSSTSTLVASSMSSTTTTIAATSSFSVTTTTATKKKRSVTRLPLWPVPRPACTFQSEARYLELRASLPRRIRASLPIDIKLLPTLPLYHDHGHDENDEYKRVREAAIATSRRSRRRVVDALASPSVVPWLSSTDKTRRHHKKRSSKHQTPPTPTGTTTTTTVVTITPRNKELNNDTKRSQSSLPPPSSVTPTTPLSSSSPLPSRSLSPSTRRALVSRTLDRQRPSRGAAIITISTTTTDDGDDVTTPKHSNHDLVPEWESPFKLRSSSHSLLSMTAPSVLTTRQVPISPTSQQGELPSSSSTILLTPPATPVRSSSLSLSHSTPQPLSSTISAIVSITPIRTIKEVAAAMASIAVTNVTNHQFHQCDQCRVRLSSSSTSFGDTIDALTTTEIDRQLQWLHTHLWHLRDVEMITPVNDRATLGQVWARMHQCHQLRQRLTQRITNLVTNHNNNNTEGGDDDIDVDDQTSTPFPHHNHNHSLTSMSPLLRDPWHAPSRASLLASNAAPFDDTISNTGSVLGEVKIDDDDEKWTDTEKSLIASLDII
jgi:hypothetical protein